MKKLTKEQKEAFKKVQEKGMWNYVLKYGLVWGFAMLILMEFIEGSKFNIEFYEVIIWLAMGLLFGFFGWLYLNRKLK